MVDEDLGYATLDETDCEALVNHLNALPALGGPFGGDDEAIWRARDLFKRCAQHGCLVVPIEPVPEKGGGHDAR